MGLLKSLVVLSPGLAAAGEVLRVPLKRRDRSAKELQASPRLAHSRAVAKDESVGASPSLPVRNFKDSVYTATVQVGTPAVDLDVVVDTGSADLWVFDAQPTNEAAQTPKHLYDHSKSSSYKANGKSYDSKLGDGHAKGVLSQDTVGLGGLTLTDYAFAEVNDVEGLDDLIAAPMDGMLGLAQAGLASDGITAPMKALSDSKQLSENAFSLYWGQGDSSELVLGGDNKAHYTGDFQYVALNTGWYWSMHMGDIRVGGKQAWGLFPAQTAMVATSDAFISGPPGDVKAIMKLLGAEWDSELGLFTLACDKVSSAPEVTFTFGTYPAYNIPGVTLAFSAEDLLVPEASRPGGNVCPLAFAMYHGPFLLGDVFLRRYYVKFDLANTRIGFANLTTSASAAVAPIVV